MPAPSPKSATILIIEDHDDSRDALGQIIASLGHRVVPARSGAEALELLTTVTADLVLCDLRMPGMSGFDFLAAVRRGRAPGSLPVVALTGLDHHDVGVRIRDAGFTAHLVKPLDYDAVVTALDRLLG